MSSNKSLKKCKKYKKYLKKNYNILSETIYVIMYLIL